MNFEPNFTKQPTVEGSGLQNYTEQIIEYIMSVSFSMGKNIFENEIPIFFLILLPHR